ncbi:MAG: four-helix bundle copper-binding protein, partial [Gammaproteobacteria bacterium HGW-Gammaproteobacteria-11]
MTNSMYQSCIQACWTCAQACEMCASACLREEDVKAMA